MFPDPAGNGPRFAHQQTFCAALARQYIAQLFGKLCDCSAGSDAADEVYAHIPLILVMEPVWCILEQRRNLQQHILFRSGGYLHSEHLARV